MAKIISFMYCDSIQHQQQPNNPTKPLFVLTNPILQITPLSIPGNYSFSIAVSIGAFDSDINNNMRVNFTDPQSNILYDTTDIPIKVDLFNDNTPKEYRSVILTIDIRNIPIKHQGIYRTTVLFNDELIGDYEISAFQAPNIETKDD